MRFTVGGVYVCMAKPDLATIRMSFRFVGRAQDPALVAELQARQEARGGEAELHKREEKGREAWLEYLAPVHAAYMASPFNGKAALLARVVKYVLTGR
jgi:hypothetical protein